MKTALTEGQRALRAECQFEESIWEQAYRLLQERDRLRARLDVAVQNLDVVAGGYRELEEALAKADRVIGAEAEQKYKLVAENVDLQAKLEDAKRYGEQARWKRSIALEALAWARRLLADVDGESVWDDKPKPIDIETHQEIQRFLEKHPTQQQRLTAQQSTEEGPK